MPLFGIQDVKYNKIKDLADKNQKVLYNGDRSGVINHTYHIRKPLDYNAFDVNAFIWYCLRQISRSEINLHKMSCDHHLLLYDNFCLFF